MKELNTNEIAEVSGGCKAIRNFLAKADIIISGLAKGESWSTIGQNISDYFAGKYGK